MLLYVAIFVVTVILYVLLYHYDYLRSLYLASKIPGPPALPIVGSGLLFLNKTPTENFMFGLTLIEKYGAFSKVWLGPELHVLISDPNDVEIIMSSSRHIDKSSVYGYIKSWLNEGLLLSSGKKWHDRRKIITPAFHFSILERYAEVFDRLGNTVVSKLDKLAPDEHLSFYPIAVLYALDVMCETAMGVSIDALSKPNSEYVKAVEQISSILLRRMFDFMLRNPLYYKLSKLSKMEAHALRVLHGFTDSVIRGRRQELLENNQKMKEIEDDKQQSEFGIRKKRAFLDILLQSNIDGKPLTDLEIREEVDTFMFEGHDTTTSGITFCLYNIAKHPEVYEKCVKEIYEVFGMDLRQPSTLTKLNELSYLELVIKESLRMFPSVPIVGRLVKEDVKLTNNRVLPRGANVLIPIMAVHYNDHFFKDAEQFRPERFLEERSMEAKNPFAYIPFAAGPRNCIGQKFAMYEIKSIISKILRNFDISLTKDSVCIPEVCAELILRPASPIKFYFKRRTGY